MIESGLYSFVLGNAASSFPPNAAMAPLLGAGSPFFFSYLPPNAPTPAVILDRLKSPDAEDTLDARTPAPGTLIEGHFQFGSVAQDNAKNPANSSGYLSACLLSQALRRQLTGLATGDAALPDGTLIKNVYDWDEFDAHYEVGGTGYMFRRILLVTLLFQETS
jgi:hypothetical protein